jgi:hypothetical protein
MLKKISYAFSAGALGGLINSVAVWLFGILGITMALGVKIAPHISPEWLYPRIVWGGLWGLLFLIPAMKGSVLIRGFVYSIGPSAVMLFIVFPGMGKGVYGLKLGTLTPVFVLLFNFIWGAAAAMWYRYCNE